MTPSFPIFAPAPAPASVPGCFLFIFVFVVVVTVVVASFTFVAIFLRCLFFPHDMYLLLPLAMLWSVVRIAVTTIAAFTLVAVQFTGEIPVKPGKREIGPGRRRLGFFTVIIGIIIGGFGRIMMLRI